MKKFLLSLGLVHGILSIDRTSTQDISHKISEKSILEYVNSYLMNNLKTIPLAENSTKKAIIFDLDGVLCTTNRLRALQEIGMKTIGAYCLDQIQFPSERTLFKALEKAPAVSTEISYTHEGLQLPGCMIDWQKGIGKLQDIQNTMVYHILSSNMTPSEKNMAFQTVVMMTTPEKFIATRQIISDGVQLARTLKKLGYKIYILSNWDPYSFPLFIEKFPELFRFQGQDLFDGIMISGKQQMIKPYRKIYQACLHKYNIHADQAVFIDDTIENVQAAQNCGIDAIHVAHKNMYAAEKKLIKILTQ